MSDDQLIKRCQNGDREAFTALLEQHYNSIYRIAYQWCDDQHNAQDITQLVCMKLARSIRQFEFRSSFTTWLYSLVLNCARDYYKSPRQRNQREEPLGTGDNEAVTDDRQVQRLYARQVLQYIDTLQTDLRETLVLIYAGGLNHRQVAETLDVKESTISWRVHEARKILKHTFDTASMDGPESRGLI